jgi:3-deoxy-D-manno-oct-2-ulosonic acid (Kdo) hydroxylase
MARAGLAVIRPIFMRIMKAVACRGSLDVRALERCDADRGANSMELIPIDVDRQDGNYRDHLCRRLEEGNILLLCPTPFAPSAEDGAFLREQRQTASASHKNIAYKPHLDKITGVDAESGQNAERTRRIISEYSRGALVTLEQVFPNYARYWRVDYASFRPVEEQGRDLPIRHRNDLMHVDAFPTRPTHGGRILRMFTNIHPTRDRVWGTADSFEVIAERHAVHAGLKNVTSWPAAMRRTLMRMGSRVGLKIPDRSAYDEFMLRFHHYLKADEDFQKCGQRHTAAFPPGSSWITFTDQVAHKALSGQYALEQTCIVPFGAMLQPEYAPVRVLERLAGTRLMTPKPLVLGVSDVAERVHA